MEPLCVVCQTTLYEGGAFRGMGDGTGQRFAHEECYWKNSAEASEKERDALRAAGDALAGCAGCHDHLMREDGCPRVAAWNKLKEGL